MKTRLIAAAFIAAALGTGLATHAVVLDTHPVGVSVGTSTAYCSADIAAHPFTCQKGR